MAPARKRTRRTTKRTPARKTTRKTTKKATRRKAPARKTARRKTTKKAARKPARKATRKAAPATGAAKPAGSIPLKNRQGKAVKKSDTFSKSDLVEHVLRANPELPKAQARKVVNDVFETVEKALRSCDKATITGFGSFNKKKIAARRGGKMVTNPFTGEKVRQKPRPARLKINFRAAPALKQI